MKWTPDDLPTLKKHEENAVMHDIIKLARTNDKETILKEARGRRKACYIQINKDMKVWVISTSLNY